MPLEAINTEAAREKSIRHGHPSTLHLWWARRPLAACRAVLFSQLVDDPSSVPEEFPTEMEQEKERHRLHTIIATMAKWENSTNKATLNAARREIARSIARWRLDRGEGDCIDKVMQKGRPTHNEVDSYLAEKAPPVYDPFCGGGSIPLEAQRLGLRALASDLNPVAVLITKALIEIPPHFAGLPPVNEKSRASSGLGNWSGAKGLAEDVRYYGKLMWQEAQRSIGSLYPRIKVTREVAADRKDLTRYLDRELNVIAWLWARTVTCPNPACSTSIPLARSFWISQKRTRAAWISTSCTGRSVRFSVRIGKGNPEEGSVGRAGARCLHCGQSATLAYIRSEGKAGKMRQQLMAVVLEGNRERLYINPSAQQESLAESAEPADAPETYLPEKALSFRVQAYGMRRHRDLFTPRQLVALTTFSDLVRRIRARIETEARNVFPHDGDIPLRKGGHGAKAYSEAVATYLALATSKLADYNSSLVIWSPSRDQAKSTFARQALPMVWDFAEVSPFSGAAGDLLVSVEGISKVLKDLGDFGPKASVFQADSASEMAQERKDLLLCTDPPYYDNIGYADLSDFFYVWLRRSLREVFPDLFEVVLTPKRQELIASPFREQAPGRTPKDTFEQGLRSAFESIRGTQMEGTPIAIYYAFKQAETSGTEESMASSGWESMLSGLLQANLSVVATWPVRTERGTRSVGIGTNALASSIVLACRPRPESAPIGTRSEFIALLKSKLPSALKRLHESNIAPVDLAQSAIGPGMAIFSAFSRILEADGSPMSVRSALGLINHSLDEVLAVEEAEYDADTRWAITWFTQYGFERAVYGDAETLSKAHNTSVHGLERAGIVEARAGKVRLLKRDELGTWHPTTDDRFTIWEACQHLIKTLELDGEAAAARLLKQLDSRADAARDLAYRLYQHCDRKGDAEEARAYNGLVVAWPRLAALAAEEPRPVAPTLDFT